MNGATVSIAFAAFLALFAGSCAPKTAGAPVIDVPAATATTVAPPSAGTLPPPTLEEQDLAKRLRATVSHLSVDVGERNLLHSWNLATATDDIAVTLEKMGYEARRQGVVVGDDVVQNVEAHVSGGEHGGQAVVIGAHFDTHEGTPGADVDASGVAAVMELARELQNQKSKRAIRFAFLVNGEEPHLGTDHMGSLVYAKGLVADGVQVTAMLALDGIGVFSSAPNSEHPPAGVGLPSTADFLAIIGNEASRSLTDRVATSMRSHLLLPVAGQVFAADVPFAASADQWAFWTLGLPAVMITDTAPFRSPDYRQKTDLPEKLDFDRMARVVSALEKTIVELAGRGWHLTRAPTDRPKRPAIYFARRANVAMPEPIPPPVITR